MIDINEPRQMLPKFRRCKAFCQLVTCFNCVHLKKLEIKWRYDMLRAYFCDCLNVPNDTFEITSIAESDNKNDWSVTFLFYPGLFFLLCFFWVCFIL